MSTTVEPLTVEREAETHPPLLAHIGFLGEPVAFCGAKVMGIPAGETYPHVCKVCLDLDPWRA